MAEVKTTATPPVYVVGEQRLPVGETLDTNDSSNQQTDPLVSNQLSDKKVDTLVRNESTDQRYIDGIIASAGIGGRATKKELQVNVQTKLAANDRIEAEIQLKREQKAAYEAEKAKAGTVVSSPTAPPSVQRLENSEQQDLANQENFDRRRNAEIAAREATHPSPIPYASDDVSQEGVVATTPVVAPANEALIEKVASEEVIESNATVPVEEEVITETVEKTGEKPTKLTPTNPYIGEEIKTIDANAVNMYAYEYDLDPKAVQNLFEVKGAIRNGQTGETQISVDVKSPEILEKLLSLEFDKDDPVFNISNTAFGVDANLTDFRALQRTLQRDYPGIEIRRNPTEEEIQEEEIDQIAKEREKVKSDSISSLATITNSTDSMISKAADQGTLYTTLSGGDGIIARKQKMLEASITAQESIIKQSYQAMRGVTDVDGEKAQMIYDNAKVLNETAESQKFQDEQDLENLVSSASNLQAESSKDQYDLIKLEINELKGPAKIIMAGGLKTIENYYGIPKPLKHIMMIGPRTAASDISWLEVNAPSRQIREKRLSVLARLIGASDNSNAFDLTRDWNSLTSGMDPDKRKEAKAELDMLLWGGGSINHGMLKSATNFFYTTAGQNAAQKTAVMNTLYSADDPNNNVMRAFLSSNHARKLTKAWELTSMTPDEKKLWVRSLTRQALEGGADYREAIKADLLRAKAYADYYDDWPRTNNWQNDALVEEINQSYLRHE